MCLFALWFLKFPSLRYGGYILVISLIVIPFLSYLILKCEL